METSKSCSNGKLSRLLSPKSSSNGGIHTEDFLIDFFPELVSEAHSLPKDIKEMQPEDNMVNGHRSLIDDLSIQNEKLKQMNKELKEKSLLQESQIAKYETDLSEKMQAILTVNQELEEMKEEFEKLKRDKEIMEKEATQLKAQIGQLLETRDKNNEASNQIIELQKDISSKEKVQRKLKNELESTAQKLVEKNGHFKRMKSANKKLWNIIMEMSDLLSKHSLLTAKKKEQCLKEIDDQMSISDFSSEGENIKVFLCGLSSSSTNSAMNKMPTEPPVVDSRSSIERHRHAPAISAGMKSYSSNYFMKTHKDVIEDLVSEDCNELNHFRQQLSVRNEPISPIPPTPPPKNAKAVPPVFIGKRLFHQQSESFEVENVVERTSSTMNLSEYTISSKLNQDGSLKLDFSANYDTHLSFDMNTRKVSCTVMPSIPIRTDHSKVLVSSTPQTGETTLKSNVLENVSNCSDYVSGKKDSMSSAAFDEGMRDTKKVKMDSKGIEIPYSPAQNEKQQQTHEKKTLNDIGRSGRVYSAFISPSSENRVTVIPSVRVSPRQLKGSPSETDQSADNKISVKESPKKRKKRARKIKSSDELFQSSILNNKKKTKRRKTLDFENNESGQKEETNEDSNNEDESKQTCQASASPKSTSLSHCSLKKDSCLPSIQPQSDILKAPLNEEPSSEELPEQNNEMDFSDIQVSPFNPSTFVPRGLFEGNKLVSFDNSQKFDHGKEDSQQMVESCINEEPSCFESLTKLSTTNPVVPNGITENNLKEASPIFSDGHLVSSTLNDGLDSDHSLVIAEDIEQKTTESVENSPAKSESGRKGARKRAKKPKAKKGLRKTEVPDAAMTIDGALQSLEEMKFTDTHFKQNQHTLVNALINPNNAAGSKEVVYQVLKYLISTRANPLIGYFMSGDESVLMPLKEKCIVQALFQISKKNKSRLYGLLPSIVNTAYDLILAKESFQIYGVSSLCRVMTEICRRREDKQRPLMLCAELLKLQHKFAPYLIASVAGVWKDLFSVDSASDEERIFHSSIMYGTQKKPPTLNEQQWKHCSKVLSTFLSAQFPYQINEMVSFLVHKIEKNIIGGLEGGEEFILSTPLVVFTAVEGWSWAKEVLIDQYIIPLLVKFSEQEVNEKAFTIFCQLYADICYFCPNEEDPHEVFMEFFSNELDDRGGNVRNAAAMAQMKLLLHKKQLLPQHLTEWVNQIQERPEYVEYAEKLFQRRILSTEVNFLDTEVRL